MADRNLREDRDRKKFAFLKTILNARRQRQLMQQSILNRFIARRRLFLKYALLLSFCFSFTKARKMSARFPYVLNCFLFLARPLRVFLISLFRAALLVGTFLFGVFLYWFTIYCVFFIENLEVEIVYGLKLLYHFATILSKLSSQSPPRSATACAVRHSGVKTLKHIHFHIL